jgi:hypothetical protein
MAVMAAVANAQTTTTASTDFTWGLEFQGVKNNQWRP